VTFENGTYAIDEATAEWLTQRTRPFAVLACAGKFRTGKSFLLNRLLRRPTGFGVGSTVQACTRGIWACMDFLPAEGDDGVDVLVLDTEGIDALDAESEHDVKIFALAVLLSSSFAYNSMSHLDEAAVQTLSLMTRVAESVSDSHSPTLYWILRDFALQLADSEGKPISHAEYLEQALAPPVSSTKCATREALRSVFPTRHLVTLPRPHRNGIKLDPKSLHPKFEQCLDVFRSHVCTHAQPVSAAGVPLTGTTYVALLRDLVARVNQCDTIPKLEDSWTLLAKVQHAEAEAVARSSLLTHTQSECPTAPEGTVVEWVAAATRAAVDAAVFMAPRPDTTAMHERLRSETLSHARALGRVQDEEELAASLAETALAQYVGGDYTQPHLLLEVPEAQSSTVVHLFRRHLLSRLAATLRPLEDHFVQKGRHEAEVELEALRRDLEETRDRERTLTEGLTAPRRVEDACTCTDDLPEHEVDVRECAHDSSATPPCSDEADAARMVVELEACLAAADERAQQAQDETRRSQEREHRLRSAFDESMEALRRESVSQIEAHRRARDEAVVDAQSHRDRLAILETECRELRDVVRHGQDRAVEMHRTTLDELRRRETEARGLAETQRREYTDVLTRAETGTAESRALKRRVDELLEEREDLKRLRTAAHQVEVERAREDAERESLRAHLARTRSDGDALRAANVDLENRLAVSEAAAKLDTCRRALG
jgi:hypothetical protein